jgi:hypothetical protein
MTDTTIGAARALCTKRGYATKREAKRVLARQRTVMRGATVRRCYRCPQCGWWHLTSRPNREPQRR